jgi:two-component system cell cycle sensor histidine kinase/response regulator CckA
MPNMSGRELARRIAPLQQEMQVIFTSGFSEERIGEIDANETFLQKPFTLDSLTRTVREVLDARRARVASV